MTTPDKPEQPDEQDQPAIDEPGNTAAADAVGEAEAPADQTPDDQLIDDSPTPGQRVSAARESAGMSIEELASLTKLARHTLESLEADRFEDMSEAVYVRGYYRKCAKVLNLDADSLIEGYEFRVKPVHQAPPAKVLLAGSNPEMRSSGLRTLMVLLLVTVLILAVLWWARRSTQDGTDAVVIPGGIPTAAVNRPRPAASSRPTDNPATTPSPAITVPEPEPETGVAEPQAPVEETTQAAVADEAAADSESGESASTVAESADAEAEAMNLEFQANSWVQIEDASGETLVSRLMVAGQSRRVAGEPPFTVFLGNAPGVTLVFAGQSIDLAPYTRSNDTARLTVPETR